MKPICPWFLLVLGTALMLLSGCAAPAGRLQITALRSESLKTDPAACQRLAIVPVWFTISAYTYSGLTSSELMQIARAAGRQSVAVLVSTITNRGYQLVGQPRALCCEDDLAAYDAETRQLLDEVRIEFWGLTRMARTAAAAGTLDQPFKYKLKAPLMQLQQKLGVKQADALVLVESTVLFETPAGRRKRLLWDWTGASLFVPAASTADQTVDRTGTNVTVQTATSEYPVCMEHTIAIVNPRTQDVLLWTSVRTPGANVQDFADLRVTIFDLLSALPLIESPARTP